MNRVDSASQSDITALVERWSRGDQTVLRPLIALVYDDLRGIARRQLRRAGGSETISTTVLVNEVYLKLAGVREGAWGGRAQFFAFCAKAMRHILIDHARKHLTAKRGGGSAPIPLTAEPPAETAELTELLALDEALCSLATRSQRMSDVVECRFFGDLSVSETAETLGVSSSTVEREWARARVYLFRMLSNEPLVDVTS